MKDNFFRAWDYKFKEFCYFSAMGGFQNLKRILNIKNIDQYINRKDTNGQKIYENDIVEYYGVNSNGEIEKMIAVVEWCLYGYFFNDQRASAICTIIGNIYENPEIVSTLRASAIREEELKEALRLIKHKLETDPAVTDTIWIDDNPKCTETAVDRINYLLDIDE